MAIIDLLTICFILCLFSIGFKLIETARAEETYEADLRDAQDEIKILKSEVAYLNSYVEHLRVQINRKK